MSEIKEARFDGLVLILAAISKSCEVIHEAARRRSTLKVFLVARMIDGPADCN
jgi:hypothetical protein